MSLKLEELFLGNRANENSESWNNFCDCVPAAIGRLIRLKKLDLWYCSITALPDSIGDLEQAGSCEKL